MVKYCLPADDRLLQDPDGSFIEAHTSRLQAMEHILAVCSWASLESVYVLLVSC